MHVKSTNTKNKSLVCIYSGEIPSTVFIERLIKGLVGKNIELLVVGYMKSRTSYPGNVKKEGYRNKPGKMLQYLRFRLLFLLKNTSDWRKLKKIRKGNPHIQSFPEKINWYIKVMPVIWYKPDIFHLQWVKNIKEWIFLQEFGIKVVASLRGAHINYSPLASPKVKNDYLTTFPFVDAFHGVSKTICSEARKYGIPPGKCKVIYSGLDLTRLPYYKKEASHKHNSDVHLLSVGRPHWKKGYMFALDACHILQNRGIPFTYEIIGGCSEEMLFQIHQLGLTENVVVKNATPFNQIIKIIQQSDLVILPSVEEGIANVVLEAMALGTPVISTNCGGMPEIIQEGKTGWLVPVRDPEALANKIVHVSRAPAEEINRITAQARRYIENYHQLDGMTEGMINLYNQTIYAES